MGIELEALIQQDREDLVHVRFQKSEVEWFLAQNNPVEGVAQQNIGFEVYIVLHGEDSRFHGSKCGIHVSG